MESRRVFIRGACEFPGVDTTKLPGFLPQGSGRGDQNSKPRAGQTSEVTVVLFLPSGPPGKTNIAMENPPFEDVFFLLEKVNFHCLASKYGRYSKSCILLMGP